VYHSQVGSANFFGTLYKTGYGSLYVLLKEKVVMERLFITGGSSYLGQHLVPLAVAQGWEVVYSYFTMDPWAEAGLKNCTAVSLDLRNPTAVRQTLDQYQPSVILNLAGSNRIADMSAVILGGATNLQQASGARLIHLSTDVIFDGKEAPYDEDTAVPKPLHEYGRAKASAEKIIQQHPNHLIIRTSLIYGLQQIDHSTGWIIENLKQGQPVTLFSNQWRNPVWVQTLAEACLELATRPDVQGILNVAGQQVVSRAELGEKLLDWWGVPLRERATLNIAPAPDDAPWPADTRLLLSKAQSLLQTPLLGLDEVLRRAKA
jgi:dTDP-4-dehydrorhamnose reductase